MRVGVGADHGGFEMKEQLARLLTAEGHEVVDFGNKIYDNDDDYPDFAIPLARAVASGEVERGILVCGSGVGASVAANKVSGARAALCHDDFSARQGVEDDALNILCFGGRTMVSPLHGTVPRTFSALSSAVKTGIAGGWPRLLKSKRKSSPRQSITDNSDT